MRKPGTVDFALGQINVPFSMNVGLETGGIKRKEINHQIIKINGEAIKVDSRHEPFTYLGKPRTVAGEDENQVPNMLRDYS